MSESLELEIRTLQSIFWSERDPDGLAFAPLADAFRRKGEVREALDLLSEGTARHPDYATGHVVSVRLYMDQGMLAEAEIAARRTLQLDPENIVALSALARALHEKGDADGAAATLGTLVEVDPDSEEARAAGRPGAEPEPAESSSEEGTILVEFGLQDDGSAQGGGTADADGPESPEEAVGIAGALIDLGGVDFDKPIELASAFADDESLYPGAAEAVVEPAPEEEEAGPELLLDPGFSLDPAEVDTVPGLRALPSDEPEVELAALAPDDQPHDEPVLELDALAPDEEPAMELAALAPDEEPYDEAVMDLGALTPDEEPVMELSALAPDEEPVMELEALAPDEEPVMELEALAPDDEPVVELAALAPDEEPTVELAALAPDDEPVMEFAALAPDEGPVMELEALAPDEGPVMELDALAPDEDPVMELGALAPDDDDAPDEMAVPTGSEPVIDLDDLGPEEPDADDVAPAGDGAEPVYTRTLAELYVKQGFTERALEVYRNLAARYPGSDDLAERIAALESGEAVPASSTRPEPRPALGVDPEGPPEPVGGMEASRGAAVSGHAAHEVEEIARDLAEQDLDDDIESPFSWGADDAPGEPSDDDGADVAGYFDRLLGWETRDEA